MKHMRNVFENLKFQKEIHGIKKDEIIDSMYSELYNELSHKRREFNRFEFVVIEELDFVQIEKYMEGDLFYVMDHNLFFVGKKEIRKGTLVVAEKSDILSFFEKEKSNNEEMGFVIKSINNRSKYIITNSEDWDFYVISNSLSTHATPKEEI